MDVYQSFWHIAVGNDQSSLNWWRLRKFDEICGSCHELQLDKFPGWALFYIVTRLLWNILWLFICMMTAVLWQSVSTVARTKTLRNSSLHPTGPTWGTEIYRRKMISPSVTFLGPPVSRLASIMVATPWQKVENDTKPRPTGSIFPTTASASWK